MEIDVLTLFPRIFEGPLDESILKRAQKSGLVAVRVHNLRDFTHDKHRVVDDKPYGGGPGMLMKPEPIFEAVETIRRDESCVVLMTPQGAPLTQTRAQEFSRKPHLVIICGHYEGVDERVREALVDEEVSIGDYVLTNGALAARCLSTRWCGCCRAFSVTNRVQMMIRSRAGCSKGRSIHGRRSTRDAGAGNFAERQP